MTKRSINKNTDWTRYYQSRVASGFSISSFTRAISQAKIEKLISEFLGKGQITVCELGGADSCFIAGMVQRFPVSRYHVVDSNDFGLNKTLSKKIPSLSIENNDVTGEIHAVQDKFDLVFSVGLIEHFRRADYLKALEYHAARVNDNGIVLITFPTPTLLYRVIRGIAELFNVWSFPDEVPLKMQQVESDFDERFEVLHRSINWWIGLTQGYLIFKKKNVVDS